MVEEPTRESNTLDLIITNFPNCFNRIETIPELSDHDIIFAELKTIPTQPGRLKSPAVMMNALVMVSALFMLLSNSKYPFLFDVFGL
jgi:hypothetical protein